MAALKENFPPLSLVDTDHVCDHGLCEELKLKLLLQDLKLSQAGCIHSFDLQETLLFTANTKTRTLGLLVNIKAS